VAEGVVIRPERDADHFVIAEVVRAAFVGHPDEVASFVERIRASEQFIPELALVAEDSSGVIAHVMLSWVGVESDPVQGSSISRQCRFGLTASASAWGHG
jgi:putative acetyltransferase